MRPPIAPRLAPLALVAVLLVAPSSAAAGSAETSTAAASAVLQQAAAETRTDTLPYPGTVGDTVNPALGDLDATLWTQLSAEYRGASVQAYRAARRQLAKALGDTTWTAALEQEAPYGGKPPAVILDVDETVLDNSAYQARLIRRGESFGPESWDDWVSEARAPAVPGALRFAQYAHRRDVRVFYVTNRSAGQEAATRRNLRRLGFPLPDAPPDLLLTEGERPAWEGDKVDRRRHVAEGHRILLLVGDNLGDFTDEPQPGAWVRDRAAARPMANPAPGPAVGDRWWGRRWIVIPNPVYGSWEDAVLEGAGELSPRERLRRKIEATSPLPPDSAGG